MPTVYLGVVVSVEFEICFFPIVLTFVFLPCSLVSEILNPSDLDSPYQQLHALMFSSPKLQLVAELCTFLLRHTTHTAHTSILRTPSRLWPTNFFAHHVNEVLCITSHFVEVFLHRVGSGALRKTQWSRKVNHTQFFGPWQLVLEGWQKTRHLMFNHLVCHLNVLFMDFKNECLQTWLDIFEHTFSALVKSTSLACHVVWHELVALVQAVYLREQLLLTREAHIWDPHRCASLATWPSGRHEFLNPWNQNLFLLDLEWPLELNYRRIWVVINIHVGVMDKKQFINYEMITCIFNAYKLSLFCRQCWIQIWIE